MRSNLSKSQVDRLGERLRKGSHSDDEIGLLDEYRRSFDDAYQFVVRTLRDLGFEPTGRPAKSTTSIVEKLRRESIRLSQVQDIAGCRFVVPTIVEQEKSLEVLQTKFADATVVDRREKPSHGYRAIHVIPIVDGMPVEIQLRTSLQHLWSELSEKLSDLRDPGIKYGSGPKAWRVLLERKSDLVRRAESIQLELCRVSAKAPLSLEAVRKLERELEEKIRTIQEEISTDLAELSITLDGLGRQFGWPALEAELLRQSEGGA